MGNEKTTTSEPTTTNTTTTATIDPAMAAQLEHASALLHLGPANALNLLAALAHAFAAKERSQGADERAASAWAESSAGMQRLAAELSGAAPPSTEEESDVDADDAEEDDVAPEEEEEEGAADAGEEEQTEEEDDGGDAQARRPRKERARMRKLVAGMFEVSPRVEHCRLREVNAIGGLGEVVGVANDQGIEETEWPIALMTPELLKRLTRRGGKYRLEWFGRGEDGARVALGRSREFKVQGDKVKKIKKRAAEAALVVPSAAPTLDQMLALMRYHDERAERERTRQLEVERHREEIASKERVERMRLEVELAKLKGDAPRTLGEPLTAQAIAELVDARMAEHAENEAEEEAETSSEDLPPWLTSLGVNKQLLTIAGPIVLQQLLQKVGIDAAIGPHYPPGGGPGYMTPLVAPQAPQAPQPPRPGGAGGAGGGGAQ